MFKIISASVNKKLGEDYLKVCRIKGVNKSKRIEGFMKKDLIAVKKIKNL
jgi:ABC-type dipeptide/oligopeptide/nickel transport system permease component